MDVLAILLFVCFTLVCIRVWIQTRAISVSLLMALLYNYLVHAYVVVFIHDFFGFGRENYWYDSMPYFVALDRTYVEAIVVSLVFANAFMLSWFLLPNRDSISRSSSAGAASLSINGWALFLTAVISFSIGMAPWVEAFQRFLSDGTSSYSGFKSGEALGAYSGILKLMLNITAMCVCFLIIAGFGLGQRLTVRISKFVSLYWCFLIILSLLFFASMATLGDRVSLIGGGLGGCVLASCYGINKRRLLWFALLFLVPVATIGVTREMEEPKGIGEILFGGVREIVDNGEASTVFPQYVAMSNHIEPYSEGSLTYLGQILIPKFLREDRPEQGPYEHFAQLAGFPEQTGWGMNFMTDCYVNYGYLAVVGGAILMGLLYRTLFQFARNHVKGQFIFAGAIAAFPLAIRSGIPGIKSVLVSAGIGMLLYLLSVRETR